MKDNPPKQQRTNDKEIYTIALMLYQIYNRENNPNDNSIFINKNSKISSLHYGKNKSF